MNKILCQNVTMYNVQCVHNLSMRVTCNGLSRVREYHSFSMDRVIGFRTEKGRDAISYAGYCYRVDRTAADGGLFWRCLKARCPGRLHTDVGLNEPMPRGRNHSHPPNAEDGMIRETVSRMRGRAATENIAIPQIYQEEANRLSSSMTASAMLPVLQSIDTSLYRARRQRFPPLPRSRPEIVIPRTLHFTESGENFVLVQLQDNDILALGTTADFDVLCNATHVYMDGTFDACPYLYRQLFTLHAFFGDRQVPLLYVLMSSKERAAYISLFSALKDLAVSRGQQFSRQSIVSDFESGLIPAVREAFPQAHHQGCYFHFTQAIWKKVSQVGLAQPYMEDQLVHVTIRRLMALGFLPVADVGLGLELIRVSLIGHESVPMRTLLEYFQRQWCETIPTSMWNVDGVQRRTNNNCEGWHSKFNRLVNQHHPNIFHLITRLLSEHATSVRERLQISFGHRVHRTIPQYVAMNQALGELRERLARGRLTS